MQKRQLLIFRTRDVEQADFGPIYRKHWLRREFKNHNKGNLFEALLNSMPRDQLKVEYVRPLVQSQLLDNQPILELTVTKITQRLKDYNRRLRKQLLEKD
jgi:hypothetical protein